MSIIACPECGGKVSDKASTCPHCGCPSSEFHVYEKLSNETKEYRCWNCHASVTPDMPKCPVCHCKIDVTRKNLTCKINGRLIDLKEVEQYLKNNDIWMAKVFIKRCAGLSDAAAAKLVELIQKEGEIPLEFDPAQYGFQPNTPKCPVCSSTNLIKHGVGARIIDGLVYGGLSVEGRAQWICGNCGHMF